MGKEKPASYYDRVYAKQPRRSRQITLERHNYAAPWVIGDSVLDLGCGVALIADLIDRRRYYGVDFSVEAIEASRRCVKNNLACFWQTTFERMYGDFPPSSSLLNCDTVLILEVLEHIEDRKRLVKWAKAVCNRRLIVMVPRDMRGPAHVKPAWTREEIEELVGPLSTCYLCGGPENDWWWLAVHDKEGE